MAKKRRKRHQSPKPQSPAKKQQPSQPKSSQVKEMTGDSAPKKSSAKSQPSKAGTGSKQTPPMITMKELRVQTICLLFLSICSLVYVLRWLRPVMEPFVLALFITFGLSALIKLQVRYFRFPRRLAIGATMVMGVLFCAAMWWVTTTSVSQMVNSADQYQNNLGKILDQTLDLFNAKSELLGFKKDGPNPLPFSLSTVKNILQSSTSALFALMSKGALVMIFVLFLLFGSYSLHASEDSVFHEIERRIEEYILTKFFVSLFTGIVVGVILKLFGVKLALAFGFFAFVLNFIPNIGSVIATLLPIPFVLLSDLSPAAQVTAIVLPGAIQFAVGNLIEPKVMGDSFDLHPVVVLMTLILWGMLWGLTGMLLATPITAVIKIILDRSESTKPIAEMMAGRLDAFRREAEAFADVVPPSTESNA